MAETHDSLERIEQPYNSVENPIGEWYLIEDGSGMIVECTEVTDDHAILHDEHGAQFIIPRTHLGTTLPRVQGRDDPRPPSEVVE